MNTKGSNRGKSKQRRMGVLWDGAAPRLHYLSSILRSCCDVKGCVQDLTYFLPVFVHTPKATEVTDSPWWPCGRR